MKNLTLILYLVFTVKTNTIYSVHSIEACEMNWYQQNLKVGNRLQSMGIQFMACQPCQPEYVNYPSQQIASTIHG